jgi:Na+/H+-dicarboxylate symporter
MDLARNLIPSNLIQATLEQYRTVLVYPAQNTDVFNQSDIFSWEVQGEYTKGSNVLGLVVFALAVGVAIGQLHEKVCQRNLIFGVATGFDKFMII